MYTPVLLLLAVIVAVVGIVWLRGERSAEQRCEENLYDIYAALELYEIEYGSLPTLAFYPDEPLKDDTGLRVFLERQGLPGSVCICPSSTETIKESGLSYLWNIELNGQNLGQPGDPAWILVEINALSEQVPPPHRGYYHILYTDGSVQRSKTPPEGCEIIRR